MKNKNRSFNVYIGYDVNEHIAAEVCAFSLKRRTDQLCPPKVTYLKSADIPEFTREREPTQATDFTYTRFMIPFLEGYKGWSVFCDCDFLFLGDVMDLVYRCPEDKAIAVVQHPPYIPHTSVKMDGKPQVPLYRKNWASLIVYNNQHIANRKLTPLYVNDVKPGKVMHQFAWLNDDEIQGLPLEWNCLDNYYLLESPKAIHYTDGGPWFDNYKHTTYSALWEQEYESYKQHLPR